MEKVGLALLTLYKVWPPCIRAAEKLGFHDFRQNYLLGRLSRVRSAGQLEKFLLNSGFERAIVAWRDPGEILSLRRIDSRIFQYHLRLFADGEIRGHYEYSPETHPFAHFFEYCFEPATEFFNQLLGDFLTPVGEDK